MLFTGGMWPFTIMPNCIVHVIMYTYYLLACLGPEVQKRIAPWKQYITGLQMVRSHFLSDCAICHAAYTLPGMHILCRGRVLLGVAPGELPCWERYSLISPCTAAYRVIAKLHSLSSAEFFQREIAIDARPWPIGYRGSVK